jgi:hypothetical protein
LHDHALRRHAPNHLDLADLPPWTNDATLFVDPTAPEASIVSAAPLFPKTTILSKAAISSRTALYPEVRPAPFDVLRLDDISPRSTERMASDQRRGRCNRPEAESGNHGSRPEKGQRSLHVFLLKMPPPAT